MIPKKNTAKDLWRPKRRIEIMYARLLKQANRELLKRISNLNNPRDILREIKKFANSKEFEKFAQSASLKMVTHLFTDAGHTWRQASKENGKGRQIYEALRKELNGPMGGTINYLVQENAKIIKTLPLDISKQVTEHIMSETLKGKRSNDIAQEIKELFPHTSKAKANLIARTETSKTSTALTKARCEHMGLKWYIWRTSEDQRVRSSHNHMDDVLIHWDNPPSPEKLIGEKSVGYYHAGNIYNCRCYPEPLVDIDYITWPHKVYYNGKIQNMSKKQFKEIA